MKAGGIGGGLLPCERSTPEAPGLPPSLSEPSLGACGEVHSDRATPGCEPRAHSLEEHIVPLSCSVGLGSQASRSRLRAALVRPLRPICRAPPTPPRLFIKGGQFIAAGPGNCVYYSPVSMAVFCGDETVPPLGSKP